MRQTILLLAMLLSGSLYVQAQVTIDQNNFLRQATFLDTVVVAFPNGNGAPAHGAGQTWDYSSLTAGSWFGSQHIAQNNNPDFPNAHSSFSQGLIFKDFIIPANAYDGLDASGYYDYGAEILGIKYPIATITGTASDTLNFPATKTVYADRFDYIQFPCTYQNTWSTTAKEKMHFELSVAAFGLNKTPGYQERILTRQREVVGYGQLIIPTINGTPSAPMDVLLIKENIYQSDSFFLGGAPAPPQLMAAFGISQGQSALDSSYAFYRPGFGLPLLRVGMPRGVDPIGFGYRPQGAQLTTGVEDKFDLEAISLSPNPVSKNQKLQFNTALQLELGAIQLFDLQGRLVSETPIYVLGQGQYEIALSPSIPSGSYFYVLRNRHGERKSHGKLIIQ